MARYDDLLIELGTLTKALNRNLEAEFPDEELIDDIQDRIHDINIELDGLDDEESDEDDFEDDEDYDDLRW